MWDPLNDNLLDARLRDVSPPAGLRDRLSGIACWGDRELDWQLGNCSPPSGFLQRLHKIVDDERLDARVRDVALPAVVVPRARVIAQHRRRSSLRRWAVAAMLLVMVTAGYWTSLATMLWNLRAPFRSSPVLVVMDQGPLQLASPPQPAVVLAEGPVLDEPVEWPRVLPNPEVPLMLTSDRLTPGPAGTLLAEMGHAWDPMVNWMRLRWPLLGHFQPQAETEVDFEVVAYPEPSSVAPGLSRALDREFLFSRGTHPPVFLSGGSADRLTVPLSGQTVSYASWREALVRGRQPVADEIRAAHFLAAMDYRLAPAPEGELALRTAGGPSVFNSSGAQLLQVGVAAGSLPPASEPPIHLTIALDVSASMSWNGRLEMARHAILRALTQGRAEDRVSLVVFREQPAVLIQEMRPTDRRSLYDALDELEPAGAADLGRALEQALATAMSTDGFVPAARRLVLITDSGSGLTGERAASLEAMLQRAGDWSLRFDVIALAEAGASCNILRNLAQTGGGTLQQLDSAKRIRWSLVETLLDTDPQLAEDVRLDLEFNPEAVAAYRLIGYDGPTWGGSDTGGPSPVPMHAGEELTALIELWMYPNDEDDIATAQLSWNDRSAGDRRRSVSQRISRLQFAPSFEGSAVHLQQAAIAAEVAEVWGRGFNFELVGGGGGYRYRPKPRDLQHVVHAARRANPQLGQRPDFQDFFRRIEESYRNSIERSAALTRAGTRGIIAGRWQEWND